MAAPAGATPRIDSPAVFLLVLRLLAVYFGTAASCLYLANRFVLPVTRRAALLLSLGPFLFVGRALLTAGVHAPIDIPYLTPPLASHAADQGIETAQTPLLGDVVYQEIPWRKAVRDAAKNGRLPLWNRFVLTGEPLLAVQQPVVLHPATWIGFLLPLGQAWTFEMALRYFLALLAAWLFFRELGCSEIPALLGAAAWAFCDYMVFFLGYPLTPAAAPLPLLFLGLRRLARSPGRSAVAITVISLFLILTSGHPESLLHCVTGAGIYFLFELSGADAAKRKRGLLLSLLAGALTLGLCAVLLIPLAEALPHTLEQFFRTGYYAHVRKSLPLADALRRALPDLQPFAWGFAGHGNTPAGLVEPSTYAGAVLWPFALAGLLSRRREAWAFATIGLLGAAVGARIPVVTDAIAKLPLFDIGINERMVFLGAFATAGLAALGAERLRTLERRRFAIWSGGAALAAVSLLYVRGGPRFASLALPSEFFRDRFLYQAVPLAASVLLFAVMPRRRAAAAVAACLVLLLVERRLEEGDIYPTYRASAFYPGLASFRDIPRELPWRTTAVGVAFVPNIAALYELEDVRGYEAMTFKPLYDTFPLWCVHQPIWFNRIDDPTRPFLSFLNVRWFLLPADREPPPGWPILSRGAEGVLVENPGVLPRAFAPRRVRSEPDAQRRIAALTAISDFRDQGVLSEGEARGEAGEENGPASVSIAGYGVQRLAMVIEAQAPAVVGTSMTAWPGWKLDVDGRPAETLTYNHAFVGFRVPAGRHEAVLEYRPDSVVAGGAISLASLAISLLLLRFPRARPSDGSPRPGREAERAP